MERIRSKATPPLRAKLARNKGLGRLPNKHFCRTGRNGQDAKIATVATVALLAV